MSCGDSVYCGTSEYQICGEADNCYPEDLYFCGPCANKMHQQLAGHLVRDQLPTDHGTYIAECHSGHVGLFAYEPGLGWKPTGGAYASPGYWNGRVIRWWHKPEPQGLPS